MSDLAVVGAATSAPASAAELAARIPVPRRLPDRTTASRFGTSRRRPTPLWVSCPEAWRRRYIKGEKQPPRARCSWAVASTTRCRRITGGSSSTATASRSTRCSTSTGSNGPRSSKSRTTSGRRLGGGAHSSTRVRARAAGRRARDGRARPAPRRSGRRPAKARVRDRARSRVDRALLPRPRDAERGLGRRAFADCRRLQGQEQPHQPRTRPTRIRKPGLYLAGRWLEGYPARELLLRADRQARHMSISTYAGLCRAGNYVALFGIQTPESVLVSDDGPSSAF